jgi:hypothetical protein
MLKNNAIHFGGGGPGPGSGLGGGGPKKAFALFR